MDRKQILDKIAKLVSLSDDQRGKPEGEAAERKVLELAHKYRIESSEINKVETFIRATLNTGKKRRDNRQCDLYRVLSNYCGVLFLVGWTKSDSLQWERRYSLLGYRRDIDDVLYLFNIIYTQINSMTKNWSDKAKKESRHFSRADVNSYALGMIEGISQRLSKLLKGIVEYNGEKGLVPLSKPEDQISKIKTAFGYENVKTASSKNSINMSALNQGFLDSKDISIYRPVESNTGCKTPMLTMGSAA